MLNWVSAAAHGISGPVKSRGNIMITEEMLRAAAVRASEIYVAHLEKGISQHEFSLEFEKSIQDIVGGRRKAMIDDRLREALKGIELTEREERYLEWLSRMDSETVEAFSGLFEKLREEKYRP